MVHGLLPGMAAILVGGLGLGLIIMCQAELTSAIPFAGGKGELSRSPLCWCEASAAHDVLAPIPLLTQPWACLTGTYGFVRLTIGRHMAVICGLIECAM
jgi:hypothetical protein